MGPGFVSMVQEMGYTRLEDQTGTENGKLNGTYNKMEGALEGIGKVHGSSSGMKGSSLPWQVAEPKPIRE